MSAQYIQNKERVVSRLESVSLDAKLVAEEIRAGTLTDNENLAVEIDRMVGRLMEAKRKANP